MLHGEVGLVVRAGVKTEVLWAWLRIHHDQPLGVMLQAGVCRGG